MRPRMSQDARRMRTAVIGSYYDRNNEVKSRLACVLKKQTPAHPPLSVYFFFRKEKLFLVKRSTIRIKYNITKILSYFHL